MTKFDRYDRATDALDDAAQSLRLGLVQLRRLPERDRAEEVEAMIQRLDAMTAAVRTQ